VAEVLNLQSDEPLSDKWEQRFQLQIQREQDIPIDQAIQTVHHLKMRKLKKMIADNLRELNRHKRKKIYCVAFNCINN